MGARRWEPHAVGLPRWKESRGYQQAMLSKGASPGSHGDKKGRVGVSCCVAINFSKEIGSSHVSLRDGVG